jgi:pyruvate/2-oxoglutarate dehydrogenase complex dihydrolipoamide acyltransferase (E2) component
MKSMNLFNSLGAKVLVGALLLTLSTESAWAIFGVWRRAAVTTAVVAGSVATTEAASSAAAANEAASAQQAAAAANPPKSPQQKLKELQSLYEQGLISASEYQASKQKILNEMMQ